MIKDYYQSKSSIIIKAKNLSKQIKKRSKEKKNHSKINTKFTIKKLLKWLNQFNSIFFFFNK